MKSNLKMIFALTITLFVVQPLAQAQLKAIVEADQAYKLESYMKAAELYKKNIGKVKGDKNPVNVKIGDCYRLAAEPARAADYYLKALQGGYNADANFFLNYADVLRQSEKFDEAVQQYTNYLGLMPGNAYANAQIKDCTQSKAWAAARTRFVVSNKREFNTKNSDFGLALYKQNGVVFTSARDESKGKKAYMRTNEKYVDLYETFIDKKGKWSAAAPLAGDINTNYNDGACCFNKNGTLMYFTRCDGKKGGCKLYVARKEGANWGNPELISLFGDSITVGQPALSPNEKLLYFSADKAPQGYGGRDIWLTTKEGSSWSEPINLGENVNTAKDEMFPSLNKEQLYFSSNGHSGMGGLDIYESTGTGSNWNKPRNLRAPLNSGADDFAYITNVKKNKGFLSSNRSGGRGNDDIYEWELLPLNFTLSGVVRDEVTQKPLENAAVKLVLPDSTYLEALTDKQGNYKFEKGIITENNDYTFLVNKKQYFGSSEKSLTTQGLELAEDFSVDIFLKPIPVEEIPLSDILYDLNSDQLKPESYPSLDRLIKLLKDSPELKVGLYSHTDARGSDAFNLELSQRRAQSAVNYLTSKGIEKERLEGKGLGETQLLNNCGNDVICDEAAHAINRRTTFKVLSGDFKGKIIYKRASGLQEEEKTILD